MRLNYEIIINDYGMCVAPAKNRLSVGFMNPKTKRWNTHPVLEVVKEDKRLVSYFDEETQTWKTKVIDVTLVHKTAQG